MAAPLLCTHGTLKPYSLTANSCTGSQILVLLKYKYHTYELFITICLELCNKANNDGVIDLRDISFTFIMCHFKLAKVIPKLELKTTDTTR